MGVAQTEIRHVNSPTGASPILEHIMQSATNTISNRRLAAARIPTANGATGASIITSTTRNNNRIQVIKVLARVAAQAKA